MGYYNIRYLVRRYRKGRWLYFWIPRPEHKAGGFICTPLGDIEEIAKTKAQKLNAELDDWRKDRIKKHYKDGTVNWLSQEWQRDNSFKELAPKTQDEYIRYLNILSKWGENDPLDEITRLDVKELYRAYSDKKRTAEEIIKVGRRLFNFGKDMELIKTNPFEKQNITRNEPRNEIWTNQDIQLFKSKALKLKRPSMALGLILALNTGQRRSDVIALTPQQYDGKAITLRQYKTKANVYIPCTTEAKNMIALYGSDKGALIINEETKEPYKARNFSKWIRIICNKAGIRKELQLLDSRRTTVVMLAEAGCEVPEIAAITGHKMQTCSQILDEVYMPKTAKMATNAINKLEGLKVVNVETIEPKAQKPLKQKGAKNG